jgi:hypothetical protein
MMLIQDFDLYTQASRSPFLDLSAGQHILLRDVGISLFCSADGSPGKWPPPLARTENHRNGGDNAAAKPTSGTQDGNGEKDSPPLSFVTVRGVSGKFYGLPLDGIFGNADAMSLILVSGATDVRQPLHLNPFALIHAPCLLYAYGADRLLPSEHGTLCPQPSVIHH